MCLRYDVSCVSVDLFWDGPLRSPTPCAKCVCGSRLPMSNDGIGLLLVCHRYNSRQNQ